MSTETRLLHTWPKTGPKLVWEMKKGTAYSSPAISGDRLLFIHRIGKEERVECLHRETGERYWQFAYPTDFEDRYGYNNGPRASPVIDGDRVYTYGAEGKLHCLKLETGQVYWKRDLRGEFKVPQDFFGVASTPLIEGDLLIVANPCFGLDFAAVAEIRARIVQALHYRRIVIKDLIFERRRAPGCGESTRGKQILDAPRGRM